MAYTHAFLEDTESDHLIISKYSYGVTMLNIYECIAHASYSL